MPHMADTFLKVRGTAIPVEEPRGEVPALTCAPGVEAFLPPRTPACRPLTPERGGDLSVLP